MSSKQTGLSDYKTVSENREKGVPLADRIERRECGVERYDGGKCRYPVVAGCNRCWRHIDAENEQDRSHQLSIATATKDDVKATEETRCGVCDAPVSAMYRPMCPECGHRSVGD